MTQAEVPDYFGNPLLSSTSSRANQILSKSLRSRGSVRAHTDSGMCKFVKKSSGILQQVARREDGAAESMLEHFGSLVWGIVKKFCFNASECEDAAQEIFIEVWKHAPRFDPAIAGETAFVAMIARRRMIDRVRRKSREVATTTIEEQHQVPGEPSSSGRTLQTESTEIAMEAFAKLRSEQQQILELAIHHGHSHEQISATTGLPLGTVKTHARRGLLRLREMLSSNETRSERRWGMGGTS